MGAAGLGESVGEFAISLRAGAGGKVIARIDGRIFLVDSYDGFAYVIRGNDVNTIGGLEGKNGKTGENAEALDHVELRGFGTAAVAKNDGGTKNRARHVGEQLVDHVFAEFFGAGVGIVIGARPVNGSVFLDDFILARASNGHGGDM